MVISSVYPFLRTGGYGKFRFSSDNGLKAALLGSACQRALPASNPNSRERAKPLTAILFQIIA
jgi:hypothetical protein